MVWHAAWRGYPRWVSSRRPVPRDRTNDYTAEQAARRRAFAAERTGADLTHVGGYSFDPAVLPGNIENFIGVAQVPIGLAGPLKVNGEHARGEYYIPLATTEGTLVASYNRGMRLLSEAGGVTTTVVDDRMQRAPVFILEDARGARELAQWIREHHDGHRRRRGVDDHRRPAHRDRAVPRGPDAVPAVRLHHR